MRLNKPSNWIPTSDRDWAEAMMAKLDSLGWRFSLNAASQLTVTIGQPIDRVPTEALMEWLGQHATECEHLLRVRDDAMAADDATIH